MDLHLHGVVKTILTLENSSWLLFVYSATASHTDLSACDEGILRWVPVDQVSQYNLIGFIRLLFPHILAPNCFFEGTIVHDRYGNVLEGALSVTDSGHARFV